jgi:glycosyltransferase involved in cell wall biosynthesis
LLGQSALKASRALQIPLVYTYHTLYEEYSHYIPLPQYLVKRYVKKIVRSFCSSVDGIIVPSKAIKEHLQHSMIETRSTIIPSPIKPYFFTTCDFSSSSERAKTDVSKDLNNPFKLITVSRFVKEKNIPFLLDVFSKLNQNNFSFMLVGYGAEQHNLENYAYNTLKLSPNAVAFVHKPEPEALRNYYDQAHLFLFASISDTQGLVLAESMARGTPVVALNGPGQQDCIVSGVNGFLVNSHQEMVNVINRIANNPELHAMMSKQAIKTAMQYAPDQLAQHLAEFYYTVLASK